MGRIRRVGNLEKIFVPLTFNDGRGLFKAKCRVQNVAVLFKEIITT